MIQAIETKYKGYRFRSRLEARWAVFFDALGVQWEYEKEGFDLGERGWYLPDFWLSKEQVWIEIKGSRPTVEEGIKASRLAKFGNYPVLLVWGTPGEEDVIVMEQNTGDDVFFDDYPIWCDLFYCKVYWGLRQADDQAKRHGWETHHKNTCIKINAAYSLARSARFEHGETP